MLGRLKLHASALKLLVVGIFISGLVLVATAQVCELMDGGMALKVNLRPTLVSPKKDPTLIPSPEPTLLVPTNTPVPTKEYVQVKSDSVDE